MTAKGWQHTYDDWNPKKVGRVSNLIGETLEWPADVDSCIDITDYFIHAPRATLANNVEPVEKPLTERQKRLREFWAKSDAMAASGMPALTQEQVNEEVSELRGNNRGEV